MERFLARFPTDFIMLRHRGLAAGVYQRLVHRLGWVFVFESDQVFVLASPQQPALIAAEGYRHILPWRYLPVTPTNAPAVLREADRALQACPAGARFAWAYRAEALRLLGRHEEAETARRKVPQQLWIE